MTSIRTSPMQMGSPEVIGVHRFSDPHISADGSGNTIITTSHDAITLVG